MARGRHNPPLYPPRPPRPNDRYLEKLEALRRWRKTAGLKMGVASDVILPRDLMAALADREPHSSDELAQAMKDVPWRLENFGEELLAVLNKPKKR
ncbi:MAG: HRDC domain-containing protein [Anaerolineales bacterium]|nr:HRDC domain-containing protein [Anaerolineales bacterium]